MLLSQAILLGIGGVENERHHYLRTIKGQLCGCAIGTALWSKGYIESIDGIEDCHQEWPWTALPYDKNVYISVANNISALHFMGGSRESIAAWVAEKERELGITDEVKENVKGGEYALPR